MPADRRPPTREEKLACVQRELGYRKRVYERRVDLRKMRREDADRELWLMQAIVADYEKSGEGSLFG